MATSAGAVELTKVDSTQQFPLGLEHTVEPVMAGIASASLNRGVQVWVYVEAAAALTAYIPTARSAGATTYKGTDTAVAADAPARILGVPQHAIASGKYGWILKRGLGEVKSPTGTTANEAIIPENGGAKVAGASTDASIGLATETVGAGLVATCYINCPG